MRLDFNANPEANAKPIDPPWVIWKKSKKERVKWFQETRPTLELLSEPRIVTQINNLLWYTGEYDKTLEYRIVVPGRGEASVPRKIVPRIFNHLYDITEQRVSRLSRLKPSFEVVPTNRQEADRTSARLMDICLKAVARRVQMDHLMQEIERWTAVFGECLIDIVWDPYIGDKVAQGKTERIGDVAVKIKEPWYYFPEPKRRYVDVNWMIMIDDIVHVEEARKRFNNNKIEPDGKKNIFSFNPDLEEKREDEIVIYKVVQKPCHYSPDGGVTYFVNDEIQEDLQNYPYSHGDFTFERHTDIDVPGRLFPISFFQHIQPIQHVYNRLTSMMVRNALLVGHPHILMPTGAAKIEAFGNGPTVISYNGQREPKILTFNSIPQEFFQLRASVKDELGQVAGIQGVSRGAPPSGVRAASMLRFYQEQEEQRASTQIIKHNELIRRIFFKIAATIGDYYPVTGQDRLIRVLGKENEYLIEDFESAKMSSEYDIIILNSTGFSETMSGRLEEIALINEIEKSTGQLLLTPQEKADVLELKNPQKAYDIVTASLRLAELNNERFLQGKYVPEPQKFWDLITHWRTTMILLNSPQWQKVPPEMQDSAYEHMLILEQLMEEKGKMNQAFMQRLSGLEGYPAFYVPTPPPPEELLPQGQTGGGQERQVPARRGRPPAQDATASLAEAMDAGGAAPEMEPQNFE